MQPDVLHHFLQDSANFKQPIPSKLSFPEPARCLMCQKHMISFTSNTWVLANADLKTCANAQASQTPITSKMKLFFKELSLLK